MCIFLGSTSDVTIDCGDREDDNTLRNTGVKENFVVVNTKFHEARDYVF